MVRAIVVLVGTGNEPRGELRIVGRDRAGADHDRVAQRAQPVHVEHVLLAGDPPRFAGVRGDEAVEAHAKVADGHWPGCGRAANGQIQIDKGTARIAGGQHGLPAGPRTPRDERVRIAGRHGPQFAIDAERKDRGLVRFRRLLG